MKLHATALLFIIVYLTIHAGEEPLISHSVTVLKEGTRSERKIGRLTVGEYTIPYIFTHVLTPDTLYTNKIRYTPFGRHGYFPADETLEIEPSDTQCTEDHKEAGFYLCSQSRYQHTPPDWLYVQWETGGAYINPHKISKILQKKPFSSLNTKGLLKHEKPAHSIPLQIESDNSLP